MQQLTAIKAKALIQDLSGLRTIREEWFRQALEIALPILEQQEMITDSDERGDGWIEWVGGRRPVGKEVKVDVRFRSGDVDDGASTALCWRWSHIGSQHDIIAYRIIPEQPTNQNGEQ